MTSLPAKQTSRGATRLPTGWSVTMLAGLLRLAPASFIGFAAAGVTERLLRMASLLIPIKLVFLLSMSGSGSDIPMIGSIRDLGQLGLTLAVLPLGALPLIAFGVGRLVQDKRTALGDSLRDAAPIEKKQRNQLKAVVNVFSNVVSDSLLCATCIAIMCALLPQIGFTIMGLMIVTGLAIRIRVKRLHARKATHPARAAGAQDADSDGGDDGRDETADPADADPAPANLQTEVARIARSTQALGQAVVLPVMVYMVAGALLRGEVDPTVAVAFLFLFRLMSGGFQGSLANGARCLQILYDNDELRAWVVRSP